MKTVIDARLRAEAARFALRFACDDCVHFDGIPGAAAGRCSLGYPPEPRRAALEGASLETCKEFDLA